MTRLQKPGCMLLRRRKNSTRVLEIILRTNRVNHGRNNCRKSRVRLSLTSDKRRKAGRCSFPCRKFYCEPTTVSASAQRNQESVGNSTNNAAFSRLRYNIVREVNNWSVVSVSLKKRFILIQQCESDYCNPPYSHHRRVSTCTGLQCYSAPSSCSYRSSITLSVI